MNILISARSPDAISFPILRESLIQHRLEADLSGVTSSKKRIALHTLRPQTVFEVIMKTNVDNYYDTSPSNLFTLEYPAHRPRVIGLL